MKRTHLPLNGLRVLDAAARHLSFTRAADELAVTPAAVGQQIRALEDLLGVVLFRRTSKGLELTDEALSGLDAIREGFLRFEEGVQSMQAGQSSHVYTIACPRDFFAAWLSPRLAAFRGDNPQLRFALVGGDADIDFTEANLDLAVRWAEGPGDHEGVALGQAATLVVAAPGVDASAPWIGWPGDPAPDGSQEIPFSVGDAGTAISAAAAGLGKARVPWLLGEAAVATGRVRALGEPEPGRKGYWLVAPPPQWRQKKVKALIAALTT
ncbi:LysR family transcriptional regulator [Novosphingobium cyanobacteriorum]|uniref:LysR family transcriptional regulator n=1 Tax=Novosphingobium cyanobacteriorum TaxID=3024215 RepID=A0ABT6CK36_9SPHN|nr:LysR family transcriptional regulator [Novosphingobium cyanobacteriorum]MDF8332702.1 LysR family transcriptional regulator [Novosphingobium cyanobacteriorum]